VHCAVVDPLFLCNIYVPVLFSAICVTYGLFLICLTLLHCKLRH
jgi:hypothetical protein